MIKLDHLPVEPGATSPDAPASRLDRILAPLVDLGDAIREEVAVSLAPVIVELDAARAQVLGLEARVSLLESRLDAAASALLGPPIAARPSSAEGMTTGRSKENQASVTGRAYDDQSDGNKPPRGAAVSTAPAAATKKPRRRATPRCTICALAPTASVPDGPTCAVAVGPEPATALSALPAIGEAATSDMAAHIS